MTTKIGTDAPGRAAPAFTPGPLTVAWEEKWPFDIVTRDAAGNLVWREKSFCHSTAAKNLQEHLDCVGFPAKAVVELRAVLQRQFADALLRAAAPDMFEALKYVRDWLCYDGPVKDDGITHPAFVEANNRVFAALSKATEAET